MLYPVMLRITYDVFSARALLRCRSIDYRLATITRYQPMKAVKTDDPRPRETCALPPPPPPKPPKDDSWVWGTLAVLLVSGVGIIYAKHSPEVRDVLTLYAPWVDDIIAIVYQENMTHREFIMKCIEDIQNCVANFTEDNQPRECSTGGITITDVPVECTEVAERIKEDEDVDICERVPPPVLTQSICEIERCIKDLGDTINNNYDTAKEACAYYNLLVDEIMEKFTLKDLKKLHHAKKERLDLVKESLSNASCATRKLDDMIVYLDCGVQATKTEIENAKLLRRNYRELAKAVYMKFQWANDTALVKDRQWEMLEEMIDKYIGENESLYPSLKYDAERPIFEGDADIILYNTYRYINLLNEDLANSSARMSERVKRAYEMLSKGNPDKDKARDAQLQAAFVARGKELSQEYKRRYDDQKKKNDQLLKDMTALQLKKHLELLETRLEQKENEIKDKFDDMVNEAVQVEKRVLDAQLADMAMKLKVVEDKLNARLKAEHETRRSHELWCASASLLAATKRGDHHVNINKQLDAIQKASDGHDQLVLTMLNSIPPSVRQQGLVPESVLKEKYHNMERTALRVALVEEEGGPLPVYILSWIQSMMLFMKIPGIPQAEYDNPPKEPSKDLDTFDLLQRSRFWMTQGNLALALRYVNHLQGASKLAAHHWYESALAHLQVRQAAEALLAHAAAMGLQYI